VVLVDKQAVILRDTQSCRGSDAHPGSTPANESLQSLRWRKRLKRLRRVARDFLGYRALLKLGPSYRKLKNAGIIDYFDGYPSQALRPQYADLWGLYLIAMERKPDVLLELGGGYSTFVFAHAAWHLAQQGHPIDFFSVDESDFWQQVVKDHLPQHLLPFVHFHRSNPVIEGLEGEPVSIFESLPVASCNFVYVDGGILPGTKIGADALHLEQNAPPDYAIQIDHREKTVSFLKRHLKCEYETGSGLNGVQTLFVRRSSAHA
jgi:hypothetical protein